MASTVRSLSNHYDTLRLKPAASGDEIVEAFGAEMRAARLRPDIPVARLAELSVAYETLRDPVKRRAYDAALGLDRVKERAPVIVRQPLAPAESRVAAFIAASLRDPAAPAETEAAPDPVPQPPPATVPERAVEADARVYEAPAPDAGGLLIDGRLATIAAGVLGLGILALAVSQPERNADRIAATAAPAQAVTIGLPPAAPVQDYVVPPQPSLARADQQMRTIAPKDEAQAAPTAAREPKVADEQPIASPEMQAAAVDKPADPLAPLSGQASSATAETAPAASAKLPLPAATIARTIERIGYACGSVASAVAVDGAAGTFRINCASGDSYRAAPVGGRYHFRRWDRR